MATPKVSVLMPSFNYGTYLSSAIESILCQTHKDLELIIVDDCSADTSRDIAQRYAASDSRIKLVCHTKNRGLSSTRNTGLAISSGDYIAFCDADDGWLDQKLAVQLEHLRALEDTAFVHSDAVIMDSNSNNTGERFSSMVHKAGQKIDGDLFDALCKRNFICVPSVMIRRTALERVGGFEESLRSLEDWVCWIRVARQSRFAYVAEPLVRYRVHSASLSQNSTGMAQNRIKAIHLIFDLIRDLPARQKASLFYSLGRSEMEVGDRRMASRSFLNSVLLQPLQLRAWVRYVQTGCCVI